MADTILIIGATGMLGEPVARRLRAGGYHVRILTRSPDKARGRFGVEYEIVAGDVTVPDSLAGAMRACQGVHVSLHGDSSPDLERIAVVNAVRAALGACVQHFTYLSGASVIAENCWFSDTRARFEAEEAVKASGLPYTIFKASWFMESLDRFIHGQRAFVFGPQTKSWHWIAADDYARMVAAAYVTPVAAGKSLFIYGPDYCTMRAALQQYIAIAHPGVRLMPMPFWAADLMARLGRRRELQAALPFFRYCDKVSVHEAGDPTEANILLGTPDTMLELWSRQKAAQSDSLNL